MSFKLYSAHEVNTQADLRRSVITSIPSTNCALLFTVTSTPIVRGYDKQSSHLPITRRETPYYPSYLFLHLTSLIPNQVGPVSLTWCMMINCSMSLMCTSTTAYCWVSKSPLNLNRWRRNARPNASNTPKPLLTKVTDNFYHHLVWPWTSCSYYLSLFFYI